MKGQGRGGKITGFKSGVTQTIVPKAGGKGFEYQRGKAAPWTQTKTTEALNRYYAQGGQREITRIYSEKSRVIRGTERLSAVGFRNAQGKEVRGWVSAGGDLVAENDVLNAIKGLDSAAGKDVFDEDSLMYAYMHASPAQQAKMAEQLMQENWEHIFDEILYRDDDEFYKADEDNVNSIHNAVMSRMIAATA